MSLSSDDLNYLIYRYLHESGFEHSAYTFASESRILESGVTISDIPMGALATVVQKGIYYTEAEVCSTFEGPSDRCSMFENLTLIEAVLPPKLRERNREQQVKDREMREIHGEKRMNVRRDRVDAKVTTSSAIPLVETTSTVLSQSTVSTTANSITGSGTMASTSCGGNAVSVTQTVHNSQYPTNQVIALNHSGFNQQQLLQHGRAQQQQQQFMNNVERERETHDQMLNGHRAKVKFAAAEMRAAQANNGFANGSALDGLDWKPFASGNMSLTKLQIENQKFEIPKDKVRVLKGHGSEVFICSWNPKSDLVASGSGDSTARIWNLNGSELAGTSTQTIVERCLVLKHCYPASEVVTPNNMDVTSMDWNCNGDLLATGCYDGHARVWSTDGRLKYILGAHKGPIFALKWSRRGDKILSAGVDKTAVVWDPVKNRQLQVFQYHTSSALDVEWISDDTFVSCSTDECIHLCRIGSDKPLRTFQGHVSEVNAIRYSTLAQRLASCSDDMTLKIWSLDSDTAVFDIKAHEKEIYTIRWSPTAPLVASASFDKTVRLWDMMAGQSIRTFSRHNEPVYSVSFSPDGKYVASGSFDRTLYIWEVLSGNLMNSYTGSFGDGGIFEISWNSRGDKLCASASDGNAAGSIALIEYMNLTLEVSINHGSSCVLLEDSGINLCLVRVAVSGSDLCGWILADFWI